MNLKMVIKRHLCHGLEQSGLLTALERRHLNDHAVVLMYHRVLAAPEKHPVHIQPGMYVTPRTFEQQIIFIKKRFELVFLDDLVLRQERGESIAGCCAITFDDGWRDNYIEAFPILQRHAAPATIFLTTGFVGTNKLFWPEELTHYLGVMPTWRGRLPKSVPALKHFDHDIRPLRSRSQTRFFDRCINLVKSYPQTKRNELLSCLREVIGAPQVEPQMLAWDEVARMQQSGFVRFGSHSVNHEILDRIPLDDVRNELRESRQIIEKHLGTKVNLFAYPNGNANDAVQAMVRECGYLGAVTTRRGLMAKRSPLLALPRIGIHEDISTSLPMFRHRMLVKRTP